MFISIISKLFGIKDRESRIAELEKKIEEAHQIALHNQCIILEVTKIITDLANDQVVLSEYVKKSAGVSEKTKSANIFITYADEDDDLIN